MTTTGISKQPSTVPNDLPKWLLVAAIWVAGFVGSFFVYVYLPEQTKWYQAGLWVAVIALSCFVASITTAGGQLLQFFKDSKIELRKVVWPNRQETLQATLMVLVAVAVMSLLLWLIDSVLFYLINYITT
jgi:preprotein translocase subunit SecE